MFERRTLSIATKHQKEKVIAPLLERELGVRCIVAENLDTDVLGTFTGEIERNDDALTTARNKCILSMEATNTDLAVASEGSFGPHPALFLAHADDEIVLFMDKKNNLEIIARELSTQTNFNGQLVKTEKQLDDFAEQANFPSHGLIVRKAKDDYQETVKGITNKEKLHSAFQYFISKYGAAYLETDMRAMYNPTRMKIIEKATIKLIDKIKSCCPQCKTPGFGITDKRPGLPCSSCGFPTRSILSFIFTCQKCGCKREEIYPDKITSEDPMYCDVCNP